MLKETQMRIQQNGRLLSSALVVALMLVTAGTLAAQDVRYNSMPGADFSKYHTYKWVNIGGAHPDQIMDAEIKQAIDSQLAAKGMTKTDGDKADLYIGYQTAVQQETQWDVEGSRAFGMASGSWTSSTNSVDERISGAARQKSAGLVGWAQSIGWQVVADTARWRD